MAATNCIFLCIFNNPGYVDLGFLLIESIFLYGRIDECTDVVVYTSSAFAQRFRQSHLWNPRVRFAVHDGYATVDAACKARLDLFHLPLIQQAQYTKFLYLDTDVLVKSDLRPLFDLATEDVLYAKREGTIDCESDYWGRTLFGPRLLDDYGPEVPAFNSGVLLFRNCETMHSLFDAIRRDMAQRPDDSTFHDQPYFVYHAFQMRCYNNYTLDPFVGLNDHDVHSRHIVHHFSGWPGHHEHKLAHMHRFLAQKQAEEAEKTKALATQVIHEYLMPIIRRLGEPLEGNLFTRHHSTEFSDVFLHKIYNLHTLAASSHIEKVLEIGFNAGFSALLMLLANPRLQLTAVDIAEHAYTRPCYEVLRQMFGDRIELLVGDSTEVLPRIKSDAATAAPEYDLIHIDGCHDPSVAHADIVNSYSLSKYGTVLVMDDYDFPNLHALWDAAVDFYRLPPLDVPLFPCREHDVRQVQPFAP
jgi:predicted O-methyltransferase YrrM